MNHFISIAIDGPAASGKSSVGLELSRRLGFLFLDTGVMYRAVTCASLNKGIDMNDESRISQLASELLITIKHPAPGEGYLHEIYVDGEDISRKITEQKVNDHVSQVSKYRGVRQSLTLQQQKIARDGNIVMVGRDIGTVVLPDAKFKFFLSASVEERAKRRHREVIEKDGNSDFNEIRQNIITRDKIDSTRELAPLAAAEDAVVINTDNKSIQEVVDEILSIVKPDRKIIS